MCRSVIFSLILLGTSSVLGQGYQIPVMPLDPPWWDEVDCGEAPDGFQYELDMDCIRDVDEEYTDDFADNLATLHASLATADTLYESDVAHATEQRDLCIAAAAGDAQGIAACEEQFTYQMETAEANRANAKATARAVYFATLSELNDDRLEAAEDCCLLVEDPEPVDGAARVEPSEWSAELYSSFSSFSSLDTIPAKQPPHRVLRTDVASRMTVWFAMEANSEAGNNVPQCQDSCRTMLEPREEKLKSRVMRSVPQIAL